MRTIIAGLLICWASFAVAEDRVFSWQGIDRLYRVHNVQSGPAPTVVYLHHYHSEGGALEAREDLSLLAWDELDALAEAEGFVTVTPAALKGTWSMVPELGNVVRTSEGVLLDDVGFIFALVDALVDEGVADPKRLYLTGISNGAILTYRILCTAGHPFAAAAPFVATMLDRYIETCADGPPPPIMLTAGTNDRILAYDGWIYSYGRYVSVPETMEFWRRRHGCQGQDREWFEDVVERDDSVVERIWWTGCDRAGVLQLLRVEGGGHTVPRPAPVGRKWRERAGGHNQDIDSIAEAWRFMQRFPERPEPD